MEALQASALVFPAMRACYNTSIRGARLSISPKGLGPRFLALDPHRRLRIDVIRPIIVSAASHKEEPQCENPLNVESMTNFVDAK
ncbi:hypothetical protein ACLOJK_012224 [Asimina triloba]